MTNREFKRFADEYLLPRLGDRFRVVRNVIFVQPVDWFLRMFVFETSAYLRERFDIRAAVQPLYVVADEFSLHWGEDLGMWERTADNESAVAEQILAHLRAKGLPLFDRVQTPLDFTQVFAEHVNSEGVRAYALLIAGELVAGRAAVAEAEAAELQMVLNGIPRLQRLGETAAVKAALLGSPEKVLDLFRSWREITVEQLGLPRDAIAEV